MRRERDGREGERKKTRKKKKARVSHVPKKNPRDKYTYGQPKFFPFCRLNPWIDHPNESLCLCGRRSPIEQGSWGILGHVAVFNACAQHIYITSSSYEVYDLKFEYMYSRSGPTIFKRTSRQCTKQDLSSFKFVVKGIIC